MKKYTNIVFNNNCSLDLGLLVAETIDIPTPEKIESNLSSIPNRETLTPANEVFQDLEIVVKFNFDLDKVNIIEVKKWLRTVSDTNLKILNGIDDEFIYVVKKITHTPIKRDIIGEFDVTFTVSGLRYTEESLEPITVVNNSTIYNDSDSISNPTILIRANGVVTLRINNIPITINVSGNAIIDSRLGFCYKEDKSNINKDMQGQFPKFIKGNNTISWTGNITECKVITNFRYL